MLFCSLASCLYYEQPTWALEAFPAFRNTKNWKTKQFQLEAILPLNDTVYRNFHFASMHFLNQSQTREK
jgi:hypothetical protein